MDNNVAEALKREFGYVPDVKNGEQWIVYQDQVLIVIHPENKPRFYERGKGFCFEIEPILK